MSKGLIVAGAILSVMLPFLAGAEVVGKPDYFWHGPVPQSVICPANWTLVADAQGNVYSNFCYAVQAGVKVVWDANP